jgi:hypothetical protein
MKRTVLFAGPAMREALPSEKKTNSQRMISIFLCVYLLLVFIKGSICKKKHIYKITSLVYFFQLYIIYNVLDSISSCLGGVVGYHASLTH